jgi:putative mRNA 3-end processing factor
MLKGGPSQYYAKQLSSNSKNSIFLVSYQARGSPGRKLLEFGVIEDGGSLIKAKIRWFDFSSHADSEGLLKIVGGLRGVKHVIVVHSEEGVGREFVSRVSSLDSSLKVYYPTNGDAIHINV